ncbi:hypothetical protein K9O30_09245 [Clostridium bowmanii]|uniref:hypothetical protein n=1 Tax=Clostridium bowmanii TaxID=132925 RepID=UPI001C0BF935|nr:hypothetical protein [Clostridium bowmanii]MBU3188992.1 hypothetical protein [Clostridium bowmanii]MCA1073906.1 hypothetical protein [Clostridium bowmanii]
MKKINSLFIIIFSTVVTVITMVYYSYYINDLNNYEGNKLSEKVLSQDSKRYLPKDIIISENQSKVVKKNDEAIPNTNDYLENVDLSKGGLVDTQKSEDKKRTDNINIKSSNISMEKANEHKNSEENSSDYTKEEEQSVFKVSTGKIQENLTTADKIKLLYVSFKLGKESYKKMEEYLYAEDAERGVIKALKLLKEDLSIKEYEKVRKIAGKFIDMDAAERLY